MTLLERSRGENVRKCYVNDDDSETTVVYIIAVSRDLSISKQVSKNYYRLTASFPGQPGLAGTRKVKPVWI